MIVDPNSTVWLLLRIDETSDAETVIRAYESRETARESANKLNSDPKYKGHATFDVLAVYLIKEFK